MGATEKIAQFIVDTGSEDIPRDTLEKAKRTALDCLGAALAGVGQPPGSRSPSRPPFSPERRPERRPWELPRKDNLGR